ncbi:MULTISPECIES: FMN-dependent NADH-azoreductase [unclassified Cupriavidus]|uniref:FMN-dependent NADH-azoreductase n=1 Tax=unclassified Cupriavidus TaxID=2640874 RepID=UPI0028BBFBC2|nr:NAD(P)H-dependent oxidoreductase [Cupriavidus sp. SZY C1]MDT6962137.1 NAD(P)H-dependent oxidoreductase [Cupriavidus sp. SZY C1]
MATLLHLNVSPRGDTSTSRRAGQLVREQLAAHHGTLTVIERDLAASPLPPIDAAFTHANLAVAAGHADVDRAALALSETLIAELEAADVVLITSPMHNYTVPATLKTWIDLVVRPERTFAGTPQGKQGMLRDRPVLAVVACGGRFSDDAISQRDFFTPYLTYVMETIGLRRVDVVRLESTARGPEHVARAFDKLQGWCATVVPALLA